MRAISFVLMGLVLPIGNLLSQSVPQQLPAALHPRIGITVFADGKPVNQQTELKIDTKQIRFKAILDTTSAAAFGEFKPELLIKNTEAILARNSRKIAQVDIVDGQVPDGLMGEAQPEDHIVFKLTLVAQKKDGTLVSLPEEPLYNFVLRK